MTKNRRQDKRRGHWVRLNNESPLSLTETSKKPPGTSSVPQPFRFLTSRPYSAEEFLTTVGSATLSQETVGAPSNSKTVFTKLGSDPWVV
jgi:hypothetical protein